MTITVITMYRGHDAEMFTTVIGQKLTAEQRGKWRKAHNCDEHYEGTEDAINNMFFRTLEVEENQPAGIASLQNVDGESTLAIYNPNTD